MSVKYKAIIYILLIISDIHLQATRTYAGAATTQGCNVKITVNNTDEQPARGADCRLLEIAKDFASDEGYVELEVPCTTRSATIECRHEDYLTNRFNKNLRKSREITLTMIWRKKYDQDFPGLTSSHRSEIERIRSFLSDSVKRILVIEGPGEGLGDLPDSALHEWLPNRHEHPIAKLVTGCDATSQNLEESFFSEIGKAWVGFEVNEKTVSRLFNPPATWTTAKERILVLDQFDKCLSIKREIVDASLEKFLRECADRNFCKAILLSKIKPVFEINPRILDELTAIPNQDEKANYDDTIESLEASEKITLYFIAMAREPLEIKDLEELEQIHSSLGSMPSLKRDSIPKQRKTLTSRFLIKDDDPRRYECFDTVRQYINDDLSDEEKATFHRSLQSLYYDKLAESRKEPAQPLQQQQILLEKLIYHALEFAKLSGQSPGELNATCRAVGQLLEVPNEDIGLLEASLPFIKACDIQAQARIYAKLGDLYATVGKDVQARQSQEEAKRLFKEAGEYKGAATVAHMQAQAEAVSERWAESIADYEEALHLYRRGEAITLQGMGYAFYKQHELDLAIARYGEAREIYQKLKDVQREADILIAMGDLSSLICHFTEAEKYYREAQRVFLLSRVWTEPESKLDLLQERETILSSFWSDAPSYCADFFIAHPLSPLSERCNPLSLPASPSPLPEWCDPNNPPAPSTPSD